MSTRPKVLKPGVNYHSFHSCKPSIWKVEAEGSAVQNYFYLYNVFKLGFMRLFQNEKPAREMDQWLRALAALAKDLSLVPSRYIW